MRIGKHSSYSPLTGKKLKSTAVNDCMLVCDNIVSFEYFNILRIGDSDFQVKVGKSFLLSYYEPILTKNETLVRLYLFE